MYLHTCVHRLLGIKYRNFTAIHLLPEDEELSSILLLLGFMLQYGGDIVLLELLDKNVSGIQPH